MDHVSSALATVIDPPQERTEPQESDTLTLEKPRKTGGVGFNGVHDPQLLEAVRGAHALYGRDLKRIVGSTGVTYGTLKRWYRRGLVTGEPGETALKDAGLTEPHRIDSNALRDKTWSIADQALEQVEKRLPKASARDAAEIFAKTFDRGRLLDGEATQRVDVQVSADIRLLQQFGLVDEYGTPLQQLEGEATEEA